MRILVAAIGRAKGPVAEMIADYSKRFRAWPLTLKEFDVRGDTATLQQRESETLLNAVPSGAKIIVCDERGKAFTSQSFAAHLGKWEDDGVRDLAFLLGGADGHSDFLKQKADLMLAFGTLTWPHMLARVMLVEQIYRAQQIRAGHPYHREG